MAEAKHLARVHRAGSSGVGTKARLLVLYLNTTLPAVASTQVSA